MDKAFKIAALHAVNEIWDEMDDCQMRNPLARNLMEAYAMGEARPSSPYNQYMYDRVTTRRDDILKEIETGGLDVYCKNMLNLQ